MKTLALSAITFCALLLSCGKPGTNEQTTTTTPAAPEVAAAPTPAPGAQRILFRNVRIFDGTSATLSAPSHVLVVGNTIARISAEPIEADSATVIDGGGRTLMPGLIDAHVHMMFATLSHMQLLTSDVGFMNIAAVKPAYDMLLRGFTSVRDEGGPVFGLAQGIDQGLIPGPRIWPAGSYISQTGGHGDFRFANDMPAPPGQMTFTERIGASAIADDPGMVRKRVREQLALGASQIKLMAGGGVSSNFDPLDVTQYSADELRAAVEAAENWGTYVSVHAYTPRAIKQCIEAGVMCIEHGHLMDDATAKLMAAKGVWLSMQPFTDDHPSPFAEGSANRKKQLEMYGGTANAYALAKKYKLKTAWGTDILFDAESAARQGKELSKMVQWYTPAEVLKMATHDNAELLALSGLRSPYVGKVGVVEEDALADLLLVDGDPLANIELVADPARNFMVIMKDGIIYKNELVP